MRNPERVFEVLRLNSLKPDYKHRRLCRLLYNPQIYEKYLDVSQFNLETVINTIKDESYQPELFNPDEVKAIDKAIVSIVRDILSTIYSDKLQFYHRQHKEVLKVIKSNFKEVKWWIIGEINLDYDKNLLISKLKEKITDEKFIRLINKFIKAGYLKDFRYFHPYNKTPMEGVLSEIGLEIVLIDFDTFLKDQGTYVRYKNKFAVGLVAHKQQVLDLAEKLTSFFPCSLQVVHYQDKVHFLGYQIVENTKLSLPKEMVTKFLSENHFAKNGKATHRTQNLNNTDYEIITIYNKIFHRFYQYYKFCFDVKSKLSLAHHLFLQSFLKTLAGKYRTKVARLLYVRTETGDKKYFRLGVWGVTWVDETGKPIFIELFPKKKIIYQRI